MKIVFVLRPWSDFSPGALNPTFEMSYIGFRHRVHHELGLSWLDLLCYLVALARV